MNKDVLRELTRLAKIKLKKLKEDYVILREAEIIKIIAMYPKYNGMFWWKVPYALSRTEALEILCPLNYGFSYFIRSELENDSTRFLNNIIHMKYSSHITEIEFTLDEFKLIYE